MTEWFSYSLSDFLLFSPRTYWRMLEAGNAFLWPLQLATVLIGAALAIPAKQPRAWPRVAPLLLLALLWCFVAWRFFWLEYAPINWIAPYAAMAFFAQAALLAIFAVTGPAQGAAPQSAAGVAGLGFVFYGLLLHPLTPLLWDRPFASADVFGITPDATAVVTAGLLLAHRRHAAALLLIVPLGWLVFSGLTHLAFPDPQGWVLIILAGGLTAAASLNVFAKSPPS